MAAYMVTDLTQDHAGVIFYHISIAQDILLNTLLSCERVFHTCRITASLTGTTPSHPSSHTPRRAIQVRLSMLESFLSVSRSRALD